ncbi:MAG TPA: sulfite exporter TauE/SafE family protein [Kofleriaceae bacterium]|nr:sulfite exporter TauE/SafE family protein [Kofleriaceae bacterium]
MTPDPAQLALAAVAAFAAGAVNALAGGGSLITFPVLVAVGMSPVTASITNTVALCPGYLGGTLGQRRDLVGQRGRAALVMPVAAAAGLAGALLLLHTGESAFDLIVPFLILLSAVLVGVQEPLRDRLFGRDRAGRAEGWAVLPVALAGVYGGYFGAGMGVMVFAALGIVLADSLPRINALKQLVSLGVNLAAAAVFLGSDRVEWPFVGVMAVTALGGGALGGRLASRIPGRALQRLIVVFGAVLAVVYFAKWLRG